MPDLAGYVCALNLRCDGTPVRGVLRERDAAPTSHEAVGGPFIAMLQQLIRGWSTGPAHRIRSHSPNSRATFVLDMSALRGRQDVNPLICVYTFTHVLVRAFVCMFVFVCVCAITCETRPAAGPNISSHCRSN